MEIFLATQSIDIFINHIFFPKIKSILRPESKWGPKTDEDKTSVLKVCGGCGYLHPESLHCKGADEISGSKKQYNESYQKRKVIQENCSWKDRNPGSHRPPR